MSKLQLYLDKDSSYFDNIRWDIISLIPEGPHRILDVGCGTGATLKKLKELGKAKLLYGVEINDSCTEKLSALLDGLFIGDVESLEIPFNDEYFDYIIFGDILEHLIDPSRVLRKYRKLLKTDGYIIASIPNIKYFPILINLVFFDKFEYECQGILDRSHLRFFTKREIKKMFKEEQLEILQIEQNLCYPVDIINKTFCKITNRSMPFSSYFAIQYFIKAKKLDTPQNH